MNSEAVKEIVLKVNGDYAERELKKIQQNIVKARKEKEAFLGISDKKRPKMGLFFSYMPKRDLKLLVSPLSIRGMSL